MFPQVSDRSQRCDSNADFSREPAPCHRRRKSRRKNRHGTSEENMKLTPVAAAFAVAVGCVAHAQAQTYPSRPITMIVPFPAGGPTDTLARILGERMRTSLGQTSGRRERHRRGRDASASAVPRKPRPTAIRSTSATGRAMSVPARIYPVAHDTLLRRLRAGVAAQRLAADDRRQERPPAERCQGADRLAQGQSGQGVGRDRRRRQRRACLHALLPAEDRHARPARALPRRRAGHAGSGRGPDRPVLRRGVADAVASCAAARSRPSP